MPAVLYGIVVYLLFVCSFAYAVGFIGNFGLPTSLDGPATSTPGEALLINLGLLAVFALQHSIMARKSFKAWWTRFVPPAVERSTYVLAASAALFLLCWFWQPIEGTVWSVRDPAAVTAVQAAFWAGWGVLLLSTFLINHFELFGLRQVYLKMAGLEPPATEFRTPLLYKHVRHPIYLGFLISFWAAPEMTAGHLLFALGATGYILVGIWFEERDLIAHFGERYRAYRRQAGMLLPRIARRSESGQKARLG
jgi:protein-S-isoprenylcysteine O-methyltransferase Ste14